MFVKNICSNILLHWDHSPQTFEMLRPEKTSQNRAGRKMAEEDIKKL